MHKIKRLRRLCKTMAKKRAHIILHSRKRLDRLSGLAAQTAILAEISVTGGLTGFVICPWPNSRCMSEPPDDNYFYSNY
jgi:hypothetical protein